MTASARTFGIEETLLEPATLPPPPTRHALLVILIALAALLHVVTIGTGDLYSETEGQYAGAAREMVTNHNWLLPTNDGIPRLQKPPLLYWLIIASYKILGVNEAAARLPIALAVVATVALIFLIGEKLSDYWRGFVAGLIYLSFCGTFLLARIVMPEPLVSAFMAGAMFCGASLGGASGGAGGYAPGQGHPRAGLLPLRGGVRLLPGRVRSPRAEEGTGASAPIGAPAWWVRRPQRVGLVALSERLRLWQRCGPGAPSPRHRATGRRGASGASRPAASG